jgi:hypothetical protein
MMNQTVLYKLNKKLVAVDVISQDYASMLSQYGDSVKIPSIGTTSASDYTKDTTISYSGLGATSQILTINQQKYFAYSVDLVNEQQAIVNVANSIFNQASLDLAEAADAYLLQTLYSGEANVIAGSGARALGAVGSAVSIYSDVSASGAVDYLGRLQQRLDENDVPVEGRWVICPPWFGSTLVKEKVLVTTSTQGEDAFTNGRIGRAYGFDIRVSTNLTNYNAAASHIYAGHREAVQFAGQLVDSKIFPMETKFAEGVRGLYVYGAKVVRTDALAFGVITQA